MSLNVEYIFKVLDRFSGPLSRIDRAIEKTKDKMGALADRADKVGKSMMKVGAVMSAAVSVPLLMIGKAAIQAASDAEETRSKYATVFKDIGGMAEKTADTFAKSFGLAGSTAREMLSFSGDILTGIGFTQETALDLSLSLGQAAQDLVSFKNFAGGAAEANSILTKAILGEREALASLGMKISEEDVKKKRALMRMEGVKFATEGQAKAQATLALIMERSKNSIGDTQKTWNTYAASQRRVSENNKQLAESFGKILIPVATKALNLIEKLQNKFIGLSDGQKKTIIIITSVTAALGPLLVIMGLIVKSIGLMIVGFWSLVSAVSALIVVFTGLSIGLVVSKWAFGVENLRIAWNNLIRDIKSSVNVLEGISKLGDRFHVGVTSLVLGEEAGMRAASRIARQNSANAARKSEARATINGTVNGEMTINNNGQKLKAPLTGALGGQMAGAM